MNRFFVVGNLTDDPELKYSDKGTAYCRFTVAENDWREDDTLFKDCIAFGKKAENYDEYLRKGDKVSLVGRLSPEHYTDKQGNSRYSETLHVSQCEFPSRQGSKQQSSGSKSSGRRRRKKKETRGSRGKNKGSGGQVPADQVDEILDAVEESPPDEQPDEDIPF